MGVQGAEADHETALPTGEATPLHTTPHHTTPHHSTPHHTTPLHTTPHHTIPHHSTPCHILSQCLVGCQGNYEAMVARYRQLLTYIKGAVTRNYSEKSINSILDYISTSSNVSARPPPLPHPLCHPPLPAHSSSSWRSCTAPPWRHCGRHAMSGSGSRPTLRWAGWGWGGGGGGGCHEQLFVCLHSWGSCTLTVGTLCVWRQ